jgi:DNA-binding transcriptional regulator YhcF (GntR family)
MEDQMAYSELEEMGLKQYRVVDPNSPMPLWFQIVDGFEKQIIVRKIKTGEYLPSICLLARLNGVHPATVWRSYQILKKMAWIKTDGKRGYLVVGPRYRKIYFSTGRRSSADHSQKDPSKLRARSPV